MKSKHYDHLRSLLEKGEVEDISRELEIIEYHLKNTSNEEREYRILTEGIQKKIPVPFVLGYTLIGDVKINLNENVLHPGPETVTIIEESVKYIKSSGASKVLDLCTGSGAVAVTVAKKCNIDVVAVDISEKALAVAKSNASINSVNIDFLLGDLFDSINDRFNVIITNPPYVRSGEINKLPRFVRDFAPQIAIDGGEDGLYFHEKILSQAKDYLMPGGVLFIECEDEQDFEVRILANQHNWKIDNEFPNRYGKIRGFQLSF